MHPITAVQTEYSLFAREPEAEVLPTCRELGIGFVAYSPLGRGFLSGRFTSPDELDEDDLRRTQPRFQGENLEANLRLAAKVAEIAEEKGITPAQLALAWVLAQGEDIVPIPGTKRRTYLEQNAAAVDVELTEEDRRANRPGAARGLGRSLRRDRHGRGEPLMPGAAASLITTPFDKDSTATEVVEGVDLSGKRAIVTGAASGIGVETARALAGAGAAVTLAVRHTGDGETVASEIRSTTGNDEVTVAPLELTDYASIDAFVTAWDGPLDILVNNAGVMAIQELTLTDRGDEMQFATNHLGHFALALGLHDALASAGNARIVSVSSSGHLRSPVVFDDLDYAFREYEPFGAYGQSKTANVLFAVEATTRWAEDGITANALMPGGIATPLQRHVSGGSGLHGEGHPPIRARRPDSQNPRAGRGDLDPVRGLAAARGGGRPLLRGLQRGSGRASPPRVRGGRRRLLRDRPRQCGAALGSFRADWLSILGEGGPRLVAVAVDPVVDDESVPEGPEVGAARLHLGAALLAAAFPPNKHQDPIS